MENNLILVDIFDNKIGEATKEEAHKSPKLHRAFSVFLYDGNRLLIQQRAVHKYHSGGLWANTCCSHPRTDNIIHEAKERLVEETGIRCNDLREIFTFTYMTKFNENLFEYEFDHVLVGEYKGEFEINPNEVNDMKWVKFDELSKDMIKNPQKYASWFLICAPKVMYYLEKLINFK